MKRKTTSKRIVHIARCLVAAAAAGPAVVLAQGMEIGPSPPMRTDFEGMIGLGVNYSPEYLGSDEHKARALPLINARWRNGFFAGFPSGIGFNFAPEKPLQFGLALRADLGREESDSDYLRGMGDIEARPELSGFASFTLNDVTLRTSLSYGSTNDRKGLLLNLGGVWGAPLTNSSRLAFTLDTTFANEEYMQSYFGVTSAQSIASGYNIYSPGAGMRDVRLGVNYLYLFSREVSLNAGLTAYQLLGDAKDSPLVRSANGVSGRVGLSYRF
ncbi:MAG: MipA/OmpV family protein [Casimicrobium sp.]